MFPLLRRLIRCFFYPQECCLCGCWVHFEDPRPLCGDCLSLLRPIRDPICPLCGIPVPADILGHGYLCSKCRDEDPRFDKARSWGLYGGLLRKTIHHFKFNGFRHLDIPLSSLLAQTFEEHFAPEEPDILIPVPIHPRRLRERGYDQTLLLTRGLARQTGLAIDRSLRRTRRTVPQFGLDLNQRRSNLKGAFSMDAGSALGGKRVLIVDDVMTTGTTVGELGSVLRKAARPEWMGVLTLARVFHFAD